MVKIIDVRKWSKYIFDDNISGSTQYEGIRRQYGLFSNKNWFYQFLIKHTQGQIKS